MSNDNSSRYHRVNSSKFQLNQSSFFLTEKSTVLPWEKKAFRQPFFDWRPPRFDLEWVRAGGLPSSACLPAVHNAKAGHPLKRTILILKMKKKEAVHFSGCCCCC